MYYEIKNYIKIKVIGMFVLLVILIYKIILSINLEILMSLFKIT